MSQPVTASQKWSLGAGFFATSFVSQSLAVLAVPFYQMTLGVDPFLLSIALIVPALLASLLNPWVGQLSDHWVSRWGRRRPFILLAAWLCALCYGLVWMVPENWSANAQLVYFAATSLLLYCAFVLLNVPMTCLSFEISNEPQARLALMGFTTYFVKLGTLLYQWLFPLAQLALFSSVFLGIKVVGWVVAVLVIGGLGMLPALFCRERQFVKQTRTPLRLADSWRLIRADKSFAVILLICVLQLAGGAFSASMDYYLLVYFVHAGDLVQGSLDKGWLSTAYTVLGMLAIPLLIKGAGRWGKERVLQWVFLLTLVAGLAKWYVFVPDIGAWLMLDALFGTVVWSAMACLIPAMIADISDRHFQQSGHAAEGRYVAVYMLVVNVSAALAVLAAGLSLNLTGFDAILGSQQSPASLTNMRLVLSLGTAAFSLLAWYLVRYHLHPRALLRSVKAPNCANIGD